MPQQFANTRDLIAVKEIKDDVLIMKDGGIRQILMVNGVNFALRSEEEQNLITGAYRSFLNSVDFPLQIIVHSRKINIQKYLATLEAKEKNEPSPILQNQNAEYREFVRGFVEKNAIMEKTFFIVVPWVPTGLPTKQTVSRFLPFLKPKKPQAAAAEGDEEFRQNADQLRQRVGQVVDGLAGIGLDAVVLKKEELLDLLYNFYNPETVEENKKLAVENDG